jgi:peptidoglycan/LPS O-acetylase OafA/YrhL
MLWAGLYGTWFAPLEPGQSFNSNLGTLSIEIIGSYIIYAFIIATKVLKLPFRWRGVFYVALLASAFYLTGDHPHYIVFFIGMAMADIYVHYPQVFRLPVWVSGLVFATGIYLGAVRDQNLGFAYYQPVVAVFRLVGLHPVFYSWGFGAVLMMYGLLANAILQKTFNAGWAQMLGRYSYALFLTHTVFLGSVTCFVFLTLNQYWQADNIRLIIACSFISTLPLLLGCTYLVERVDAMAVRVSRLL